MSSYCLKCTKNTESKNPIVVRTKNGRTECFYQNVQCAIVRN